MRAGYFLFLCALITIGRAALQDKTHFYEHVEDFIGIVLAESGLQLELLLKRYGESQEFGTAANYLRSKNFRDVLFEVESLPEFKAVKDYLEKAHIGVDRMLEHVNELVELNENITVKPKEHEGKMDMTNFMRESFNIYPKQKLSELFEQKKKEYPKFRHSMEKLNTEEWQGLYQALYQTNDFKKAESVLAEHGLDVRLMIELIKALFGQN